VDLLILGEQVVAPGDGIAHRPMAAWQVARAACQEWQALSEPRQQRLG
jgi:hypothetical protein